MAFPHIRNWRGFFSDYYLGSVFARGDGRGRRKHLADRDTDLAYKRFRRLYEIADGFSPDAPACRERFIRPLLRDVLSLHLGQGDDRVHVLHASAQHEADRTPPLSLAYSGEWEEDLDSGRGKDAPVRRVETSLAKQGLPFGLLITGERLRMIRPPGDGPRGAYLEVDLAGLAEEDDPESFAAFRRLFHASSFIPAADGVPPLTQFDAQSREHAEKVSEDLKRAVFTAAESLAGGLLGSALDPTSVSEEDLRACRNAALTCLYRVLFILYAEDRDTRLVEHKIYRESYSIHGMVEDILHDPDRTWPENRARLWSRLRALFRIYDEGLPEIVLDTVAWRNIPPRGGSFFRSNTPEGRILNAAVLPDRLVARILFDLTTSAPRHGIGRERVSFRELDIESLGSVYEGLLEFEPRVAREAVLEFKVQGRQFALPFDETVRLCEAKKLTLRGDSRIVAGTEAERLHAAQDEGGGGEATDDGDGKEGIKKGGSALLVRRIEPGTFHFVPGSARKGSGSFYTPPALVRDLVHHALEPVVRDRTAAEIERVRVLDPACGSAHMLVEAMRFLGQELHRAYAKEFGKKGPPYFRTTTGQGWDEDWKPTDEEARAANSEARAWCKRRIAERCLFGVDLNPTAVALAQVALWIESLAGDRPLTYFQHHVRWGNSLLGTWSDRLNVSPSSPSEGPVEQGHLWVAEVRKALAEAAKVRRLIDAASPDALLREGVEPETVQEQEYKERLRARAQSALNVAKLLFDLRSASIFMPEVWGDWSTLCSKIGSLREIVSYARSRPWWKETKAIRRRERFFHWELEFPEVFLDAERPGFDAVVGNPPWDKVLPAKLDFYAQCDVLIRAFKGNELERRIRELHDALPNLKETFQAYRKRMTEIARFLRQGGDFPHSKGRTQAAHEDLSKYFADRAIRVARDGGAIGLVLPSVVYNGDGCVGVRRCLLTKGRVERLYGFENRRKVFPIHSSYKFVNLVFRKGATPAPFDVAFMRHDLLELDAEGPQPWTVRVSREEIERLSPDTFAFLEYRSRRDQEIAEKMYRGRPTLGGRDTGSWGCTFVTDFAHLQIYNSARDKDLWTVSPSAGVFSPASVLATVPSDGDEVANRMRAKGFLPVFEGKHIDQFLLGIRPIRWWLSAEAAEKKYGKQPRSEELLVFRKTASNTNERTCIAAILPPCSVGTEKLTGVLLARVTAAHAAVVLNSLCFDWALRLRSTGTDVSLTYVRPMAVPSADSVARLPLVTMARAGKAIADHITEQKDLWPLLWDANRAVAEAYGLSPDDFAHILASFPVMKRKRPEFVAYLEKRLAEWAS